MSKSIVRAVDLRQQVYENLRSRITSGEFDKDTRFYERTFADELGVSRTPVREALAMLEQDGLLSQAARGYRLPRMSRQQVIDVTEIRLLLEPHAVASMVRDTSPGELKKMAAKIRKEVADSRDSGAYISSHGRLRELILGKVRNRALVDAIQQYEDSIHFVRVSTLGQADWRRMSAEGMLELADALEAGDAEAASEIQGRLLTKARDSFLEFSDAEG
ncbi:transcriptional regulator, GntR family protein [Pseudooceanicola batsensis HTCC2597]|uniref:Transcriptional regulator, GntR family protein n=1 Tax=Pseudooceanicola batsensis (strain ATCC BAA-863 / DSM 15984 / KCTC 12145 / HTCC2597) TaxID=252305 RepID=A3U0S6_PSEBH|nr:GntR family transcriptional regulator [Pseudooceanicola batsensis]EAQ02367.1 transcriptional regulator, GntR family protein [Pseudooceanicola batsensis HTCC2597]